jgi:hypothetical protein
LGTIQHILKKSLKIPQGQSESVYVFCHVHKLLFAWLTDNIHHCNAVNTHLNHRRIFLFSTPCGGGSLLCMRNINCKPHWLAICCLSRIFYFFWLSDCCLTPSDQISSYYIMARISYIWMRR